MHKTWSHSGASTLALVFLAGCYDHALDLVHEISLREITVEFLHELDRFIQIMESPIFSCEYHFQFSSKTFFGREEEHQKIVITGDFGD